MILDHVGFGVSGYLESRTFYDAVLAPLGILRLVELSPAETPLRNWAAGYGRKSPDFWIGSDGRTTPVLHIAFRAETRDQVDVFHRAALAAGGRDHGTPGLRPQYGSGYYAAFVLDLDGHNVEAVCHTPE